MARSPARGFSAEKRIHPPPPRRRKLPIACGGFLIRRSLISLRLLSPQSRRAALRGPRFGRLPIACGSFERGLLIFNFSMDLGGPYLAGKAGRWRGAARPWGSNLLFKIETAVLFRPLRYHVRRPKSSAGADIFFAIFCKCAGKTDRLPLGCCTPAGVRCRIYKGFTLFPLTGRSAGSMMEKTPLEGRL